LARGEAQTPEHSDVSDVVLATSGDRRAFERLYRANVDRVFSLAVRMLGDRQRAEEATQDVFVRVWDKLAQFRGDSLFSTWVHRLAVNLILNDLKLEKRERERTVEEKAWPDAMSRKPAMIGERLDLETAIAALPRGARVVFVLHDVEGFRHEEIARMLGVTAGGCKSQLHRARMLLREALER
jgi:RNA polymerase sigma-70 factor (ECF subfamily)